MLNISVLGCGWLGEPLAAHLAAQGDKVKGSTTSPDKLSRLAQAGITPYLVDLSQPQIPELSPFLTCDLLIIAIPPGKSGGYAASLEHILAHTPRTVRIILISSTSVYPRINGRVDETTSIGIDTTPRPDIFQGEETLRAFTPDHVVLRCAGLMGYDRIAGRYFAGKIVVGGENPVNHLHRDDAIRAIALLTKRKITGTFNLCAPKHPTRQILYTDQARRLGFKIPRFEKEKHPFNIIDGSAFCLATGFSYRHPDPMRFAASLKA